MENQQARILDALDMLVRRDVIVGHHPNGSEKQGQVVQQPEYSNTGTIGIARPGELVPTRIVSYRFERSSARFTAATYPDEQRWVIHYAHGPDAADAVIRGLVAWLAEPVGRLRDA